MTDDVYRHNAEAWNAAASRREEWSTPVTADEIRAARRGDFGVLLTPQRRVPADWFPPMQGLSVLGLAMGGGQQGSIFAAAGALVTIVDASTGQLALDREVCEEHDPPITLIEADAANVSDLDAESFDLVFHPSSNSFIPAIQPVWDEAFRVLRPGGHLLAGFNNPAQFIFDEADHDRGVFTVRHPLPYSDTESLPPDELAMRVAHGRTLEFSHTLDTQIGGQLAAGFHLVGFYEDHWDDIPLSRYMATSIATRAWKPTR